MWIMNGTCFSYSRSVHAGREKKQPYESRVHFSREIIQQNKCFYWVYAAVIRMSKHPPGFMVYSTPHNFALFWQNKDRSKAFKSWPSWLAWTAPVCVAAELHANVDIHDCALLYPSTGPCADWWGILYFADVLWSMLMHVKEWGRKRQTGKETEGGQ